jgi:hypothetical protein
MILILIGVEGSGKTTVARAVAKEYRNRGYATALLDGEDVRRITDNGDFSSTGRSRNAWGAGVMARSLHRMGYNVIISAVFPTVAVRDIFRHACGIPAFWVRLETENPRKKKHGVLTPIETFRGDEDACNIRGVSESDAAQQVLTIAIPHRRPANIMTVTETFDSSGSQPYTGRIDV